MYQAFTCLNTQVWNVSGFWLAGFFMVEGIDLERIRRSLDRDCGLFFFEKTDSTNQQALIKVKQGADLPLACFAEQQTQGRGRRGKVWLSPPGSNIYLSLAWKFDLPVSELGCLSLAMGVAVVRVLKNAGLKRVGLKWPNDVLVDGRKIAGILIETARLTSNTTTAVIGIGLNYKLPDDLPVKPDQPWTDIVSSLQAVERKTGRNEIAGLLLQQCMKVCDDFKLDKLMAEYRLYDVCLNQPVNVLLEEGMMLQGVVADFEVSGEIRVRINDDERLFNSADISLRKANNVND